MFVAAVMLYYNISTVLLEAINKEENDGNARFSARLWGLLMKLIMGLGMALLVAFAPLADARAIGGSIAVVAAENFYGDVARQIGGEEVVVASILNNPDQNPHLFETAPSVVRAVAAAQLVIYNGADYDPWMERLLEVTPKSGRVTIVAADLMHKKAGDNPHLWYDPSTMPAVAKALAAALSAVDHAYAENYATRLKGFLASLQPLDDKIAEIRGKYAGTAVAATEPVFGYMAAALHLTVLERHFQLAVMNNTEPSTSDLAAFEGDLKTHKIRVLFYNKQASDKIVQHLVDVARAANIPVVGVTETCPPGLSYQNWLLSELKETETALGGPSS
jgi:zinc/manganese transport system substrate-binding protein